MRGASKSVNPDVKERRGSFISASPTHVSHHGPPPTSKAAVSDFLSMMSSPSSQTLILSDPSKVSLQTGIRPSTVGALSTVPEDLVVASSSTRIRPLLPFTAQLPHGETFQETSPFHGTISMNRPAWWIPMSATSSS